MKSAPDLIRYLWETGPVPAGQGNAHNVDMIRIGVRI